MKKINFKLFLTCIIMVMAVFFVIPVYAETVRTTTIYLNRVKLVINGVPAKSETLLYNDNMYIKLSEAAEMLDFNANWDSKTNTTYITKKGTSSSNAISQSATNNNGETVKIATIYLDRVKLVINGVSAKSQTLLYNDFMYIKLSEAAEMLDFNANWDSNTNTTYITKKGTNTAQTANIAKDTRYGSDGTIYEGTFDIITGWLAEGKVTFTDGETHEGTFNITNGRIASGKVILSNGVVLNGTYKDGNLHNGTLTKNGVTTVYENGVEKKVQKQVVINLPSTPVAHNRVDKYGQIQSSIKITSMTLNQTYYDWKDTISATVSISGVIDYLSSNSSYGYITYQLLDSNGNVVESDYSITDRLSVGQSFTGEDIYFTDLNPGQTYTLKLISDEGKREDEMGADIHLPNTPVRITEYSYSDKLQASTTITNIKVEQTYSYGEIRATLYFSGKCNEVYTNTNTNRKITWTLKDSNDNTIDSGNVYTPILASGDTFIDIKETIYDLKPGATYYLIISERVK